ncbi:KamA family radical SAM protein [Nitrospirota bacterium]
MSYKPYSLRNFRDIPQISALSEEERFNIEVVGQVFPFKTNNYFVDQLVDWDNAPNDPMYVLNFPQKDMLSPEQFSRMATLIKRGADAKEIRDTANKIRLKLNPHPAGQLEKNVPKDSKGNFIEGLQHKYRETALFFPSQGQTCHSYCTFCFRWPQFVGIDGLRFATRQADSLVDYVERHKEITDILITGGDPMVMKSKTLAMYIDKILEGDLDHVRTIRFGTKALSYWPFRFTTDEDAPELMESFRRIKASGRHLAIMAHFNHPREFSTPAAREAIARLKEVGAEIRTQSPLLKHINDTPEVWAEMWREQTALSMIPYYMFMVRDTGAQHYFGVPLVEAWNIFREAYQNVSGVARTVRGPSMSAEPGKVRLLGISEVKGEEVMMFDMIQGRNPDWVMKPFFAEYDENAMWLDDLKPAFGENYFYFEDRPTPLMRLLKSRK